jgi:C4-dicarboxylate transporter DctQ subunit
LKRILFFLERDFERVLSVFFLCTMVCLLSAVVFFRFVLQQGLSFAEEIERMAFVWFVYMGAAYAAREGIQIRVVAHLGLLSARARRLLMLVADIIWVWFNCIIIREGILLVHSMIIYPYESPALGWQMAYVYTIVPISFALMSIRVIQHIVRNFRALVKHEGEIQ